MAITNRTFTMQSLKWKEFEQEDRTYYYIHRHMSNFEKDEAMSIYQTQKEENYRAMRDRYRKNFLDNITSIDQKGMELLNASMSKDDFVSLIDQELLSTLNNNVTSVIKSFNIDELLNAAYDGIDGWVKNPNVENNLESLNKIFGAITQATKLLDSSFSVLLLYFSKIREGDKIIPNSATFSKLEQVVSYYLHQLEMKSITIPNGSAISAMQSLQKLIVDMQDASTSKATLQGYIRNIFSTQLGEYIVSKGIIYGLGILNQDINRTLVGRNTIVSTSDKMTKLLNEFGQSKTTNYKTDNRFSNVKLNFTELGTKMEINLGISTKWYKNDITGLSDSVDVMSEAHMTHRLMQFVSGDEGRYYAYNSMALIEEDGTAYAAFKAALLARFADLFISGFGVQQDFSQYIVINGKFYSIWQLILAMSKFNTGQGSSDVTGGSDPLTLSVVGLSKIAKETKKAKKYNQDLAMAYFRSRKHNLDFEELKLAAHFYPNRLMQIVKTGGLSS